MWRTVNVHEWSGIEGGKMSMTLLEFLVYAAKHAGGAWL